MDNQRSRWVGELIAIGPQDPLVQAFLDLFDRSAFADVCWTDYAPTEGLGPGELLDYLARMAERDDWAERENWAECNEW